MKKWTIAAIVIIAMFVFILAGIALATGNDGAVAATAFTILGALGTLLIKGVLGAK